MEVRAEGRKKRSQVSRPAPTRKRFFNLVYRGGLRKESEGASSVTGGMQKVLCGLEVSAKEKDS